MKTVFFLDCKCNVFIGKYTDNSNAIFLTNAVPIKEDGYTIPENEEMMAVASTNIGPLPEGQVAIKDYFENKGIYDVLVKAGIISEKITVVKQGFVEIPICNLLYFGE